MTNKRQPTNFENAEFIYAVLDLYDAGNTNRTMIAKQLGVSRPAVSKVLIKYKDNREQILHREVTAWKLRQAGKTHQQIADALQVERTTVTKILKRLTDRILSRLEDEIEQTKIEQWNQLEYLISELFDAWERSKDPSKSVTRKQVIGKEAETDKTGTLLSTIVDEDGNLSYIREARATMADLRSLLGLDAPKKFAQTDPSGKNSVPGQVLIMIPDNSRDDQNNAPTGSADEIPSDPG